MAEIAIQVSPAAWATGALVQTELAQHAQRQGAGMLWTATHAVGSWVLYQASTTMALMQVPAESLEDVTQAMMASKQVTIDTRPSVIPQGRPPEFRTALLASNAVIRRVLRSAPLRERQAPWLPPRGEDLGGVPLVVAATVLGVAAIGGVSWYATESSKVEAGLSAHLGQLASQVESYKAQIAAASQSGQAIPPPPAMVQRAADEEASRWPWAIGGGLVVAGAGLLARYLRPAPLPRRRNPARRPVRRRARTATRRAAPKRATKKRTTKRAAPKRATKKRTTKRAAPKRAALKRADKSAPKRAAPKRAAAKAKATKPAFIAAQLAKGASRKQAEARWKFAQRAKKKA